jgi:hypothetical protein
VKRDLKDWCITKELVLDKREWKLAKPCDNCTMIMVNYVDLWLVYTQVVSQLKRVKLELRELKARSLLLGACTSCPLL